MITKICEKFLVLINHSQGNLITLDNGQQYPFKQHKIHILTQIEAFEKIYQLNLPKDYQYFLRKLGSCELYFDERELGIEFYALDKILAFMKEVLTTREALAFLPKIIFIGSNLNNGGVIALNLMKSDTKNLTVFYPDDDPDDWLKLDNEYISLGKFLEKLYNSYGEDYYL